MIRSIFSANDGINFLGRFDKCVKVHQQLIPFVGFPNFIISFDLSPYFDSRHVLNVVWPCDVSNWIASEVEICLRLDHMRIFCIFIFR